MIPSDSPTPSDKPDREDTPPHASQRHVPDDDLWDLDADEDVSPEPDSESRAANPLERYEKEGEERNSSRSTDPEPRSVQASPYVRTDFNKVDVPKEVRPEKPLEQKTSGFEPLDEATGLGELEELEESDLVESKPSPVVEPPVESQREPGPGPESNDVPAVAAKSEDVTVPTPFESPKKEEDNRETLLKELQKGWGAGFRFLIKRIRAFSLLEQVSCVLIALGVVGFSSAVFFPALYDFPQDEPYLESNDFPVSGKNIQVRKAETYWREPIMIGADADTVRLGVALLPVIDMELGDASGMIRLLFRNSEGRLVGDAQSMAVKGGSSVSLSSTTGLEDSGMFSAYRIGETKPWTVEVFEAPSADAAPNSYELVFKMTIAPILK